MKKRILLLLVLCLLGVIVYYNALNGPFLFDDSIFIVNNIAIRDITKISDIWNALLPQPSRAIGLFTFALNYHFNELNPAAYHITNLVLHLVVSCLVWWFVAMILSLEKVEKLKLVKNKELVAFFAALLFCVHPVQTQAVSYISQRAASLATFFYLLSLCFYVQGRVFVRKNVFKGLCFLGVCVCALLGMFTKEIVITLPLSILMFEVFFLMPERKTAMSKKEKTRYLISGSIILSFVLVVPYLFNFDVMNMFFSEKPSQSHQGDIVTFWTYELTQLRVVSIFIRLLFIPLWQNFDYDFVLSKSIFDPVVLFCLFFVSGALWCAFRMKKINLLVSYGMFWFFLTYSANLIPRANAIFEHKLYLLSIGFCLALSSGIYYLVKNDKKFICIMSVIVIALSILTWNRNKVWGDEFLFWSDVVKKSPNKARPHNDLGLAYFKKGDHNSAMHHYNKAIEMDDTNEEAYNNRGVVYTKRGQNDLALADYNKALTIRPRYADALNNRGVIYKRKGMLDRALRDYIEALRYNMVYPDIFFNIGVIYEKKGRLDLAEKNYAKAISLDRNKADAYNNRAIVFSKTKKYDEALAGFNKAIALKPDYFEAHNNKGSLLFLKGDYDGALKSYENALKINPRYFDAYTNRAIVRKDRGQIDLAIEDYTMAISILPNQASIYYLRSMLLANRGRFKEALSDVMKAKSMGVEIKEGYLQAIKERVGNGSR